jgi:hypothetical protein
MDDFLKFLFNKMAGKDDPEAEPDLDKLEEMGITLPQKLQDMLAAGKIMDRLNKELDELSDKAKQVFDRNEEIEGLLMKDYTLNGEQLRELHMEFEDLRSVQAGLRLGAKRLLREHDELRESYPDLNIPRVPDELRPGWSDDKNG